MSDIIPDGYLKNPQGHLVPVENIREIDVIRDDLVKRLIADALNEQEGMKHFKAVMMDEVESFVQVSADEHDVKLGGVKGNVSLTSYDGCLKVEVQVSEHIGFTEELQAAKELIDDLTKRWSEGANPNLKTMVMQAFNVDKKGKISVPRLLGLRKLKMDDPSGDWDRAMEIISDSIQVEGSKRYIRFYKRDTPDGQWQGIPLDIAKL